MMGPVAKVKKQKQTNKQKTIRSESTGTSLILHYRWDNHVEASVLFTWEEQQFKIKLCSSCDTKFDVIHVQFLSVK